MNKGNSGQHFRMTTLTSVEVEGKQIVLHLACGHDLTTTPTWCTVELLAGILRKRIGKKQRCNECKVDPADNHPQSGAVRESEDVREKWNYIQEYLISAS